MIKPRLWSATLTALTAIASTGLWFGSASTSAAPSVNLQNNLAKQPALNQSVVKQEADDASEAWVPVDRIDPSRPAAIVLINDTIVPLEYAFSTTERPPQTLEPGDTVTIPNVPVPSTLLINAQTSTAVLDYAFGSVSGVSAPNNSATVTISLVDRQFNAVGFSAIDIHETGALYRY